MADGFTFTFTDAFEFADKMQRAPAILQDELTTAVTRLAIEGEGQAKRVVPVDTGHLRRSIAHISGSWSGAGATASYGTATTYAPFVEYGTSRMAAQPYMGPSSDYVAKKMPQEMAAAWQRVLDALGVG